MEVLRPLPDRRLESARRARVRVNSGSLIAVERNSEFGTESDSMGFALLVGKWFRLSS
jgi:hypothetical protein